MSMWQTLHTPPAAFLDTRKCRLYALVKAICTHLCRSSTFGACPSRPSCNNPSTSFGLNTEPVIHYKVMRIKRRNRGETLTLETSTFNVHAAFTERGTTSKIPLLLRQKVRL